MLRVLRPKKGPLLQIETMPSVKLDCFKRSGLCRPKEMKGYTFRPNFFSNSAFEIWIMVGRPCGQQ